METYEGLKMVIVKPHSGPYHLAAFYKDYANPESPVRAVYFGWSCEMSGWFLEMYTSGSTYLHERHFETKAKMDGYISELLGVPMTVEGFALDWD